MVNYLHQMKKKNNPVYPHYTAVSSHPKMTMMITIQTKSQRDPMGKMTLTTVNQNREPMLTTMKEPAPHPLGTSLSFNNTDRMSSVRHNELYN